MLNLQKQFVGNQFAEILFRFPCKQKILMVTDGSLRFDSAGFGLSEFVGIVKNAGHTVATAHRTGSGVTSTIPGSFNFATAAVPVIRPNYDQLWLFGFSSSAISASEQNVIAQFMQAGGGVFATGDHETLGAGMGANIPRVRWMRDWSSVPMASITRHDTVLEPGSDGIKQFADQGDAIPQRTFPVFFSNGGPSEVASSWNVHPVLRHESGAVDYLPDHPHESECLEPVPFAGNFAGVEEWPAVGGMQPAPQVVAVSISAGRFVSSGAPTASGTKPPVKPRSFGAISAYDGDSANVGRIVCDATWHHFVNVNLNGSGSGRSGLYAAGSPTPEYLKIQRYYLNTVRWLAPKSRRSCWPFLQAALARFDFEIAEMRLPLPHPCPWDPLLKIGLAAEEAITRHWGEGATADIVDDLVSINGSNPALSQIVKAQPAAALVTSAALAAAKASEAKEPEPSLLPLQNIRRVILGSIVNQLAFRFPEDEGKLAALFERAQPKLVESVIGEAVNGAAQAIDDFLQVALKRTAALAKSIQARRSQE